MTTLYLRTDKPESELHLNVNGKIVSKLIWEAHRKLADTLNTKVDELMQAAEIDLKDLDGIIVYEGPGSFTGLRIGMSVANAIAYSYGIPIMAAGGGEWLAADVSTAKTGNYAVPEYGGSINITKPRK